MRLTVPRFAKYWKRYIERELYREVEVIKYQTLRGWDVFGRDKKFNYGMERPWTGEFKSNNVSNPYKAIPLEPTKEQMIFKGDRVELLVGPDKGKQGIVNSIIKERNWVFVQGLNCEYLSRSIFPGQMPTCAKRQLPLMITSQVKLVDPHDEQPTDAVWRYTEDGSKVRVSVRSGKMISLPIDAEELEDFVNPKNYKDGPKDCSEKLAHEKTYTPIAKSFAADINENMGIPETRKRGKTYWY